MRKNIWREIRSSMGRFIAIFAISALGAGFYAGLKVTSPDMKATGNAYYAGQRLMDYRLVSTLGFTEADVEALRGRDEVARLMAGYGADLLVEHPEGAQVARVMSLPHDPSDGNGDYLNRLVVNEGRLPAAPDECFADGQSGYKLGDIITVSEGNDDDSLELMAQRAFTIVGMGASPSYIAFQRGASTIGNGRVDYFLYVPPAAFDSEFYTEIFLTAEGAEGLSAFSQEYEKLTVRGKATLEDFGEERARIRYDDIMEEAGAELANAKEKLADGKADLAEAEQELACGEAELADARQTADRELADAWQKILDGEQELADGRKAITAAENEIASGVYQIQEAQAALDSARVPLDEGQARYDAGFAEYSAGRAAYDSAVAGLDQLQPAVEGMPALLAVLDGMTAGGTAEAPPDQLPAFGETAGALIGSAQGAAAGLEALGEQNALALAAQLRAVADGAGAALGEMQAGGSSLAVYGALQPIGALQPLAMQVIDAARQELDTQMPALEAAALAESKAALDAGWAQWNDGNTQLNIARAALDEGVAKLETARQELADGERELADGRAEYYTEKAKAEREIADAEAELADGRQEIEDARTDVAEAEAEIADAQQELDDLEVPTWYVFTRKDSPGYSGFTSDTGRIDAIAVVIPVFFFLVSALVCLTTMTRMVEEQRPLIGTLKGLGYTRGAIAFKFLLYAGMASAVGSVLGVLVGYLTFPTAIWSAYGMMYIMPDISIWNDFPLAVVSVLFSVLCILAATWAACASELRTVPAGLLRPKAPRAGKRVFLERIGPLWRRMSFMAKVAARNLFRYKKRFFMTVIGVAGCSALLLTGFGLRNSITGIVSRQYSGINQYDMQVVLTEDSTAEADTALNEVLPQYGEALYTASVLVDAKNGGKTSGDMTVYLAVAEKPDRLPAFIDLHGRKSGQAIPFPQSGAVVTEKLADRLNLKAGDTFTVERLNESPVELTVGGVCENYIFNYIYITPDTCRDLFGEEPGYDTVLLNLDEPYLDDMDGVMAAVAAAKPVAAVMDIPTLRQQFDDMFESLNAVVWLIIAAAALLAFVVLYNLTNINITERTREIATLKVLGFYNGEVASYIYRENLMLTAIGIVLGLVLGVFLHDFVIVTAEVDEVMFRRVIEPLSYVFSMAFTLLCAGLVNLAMLRRLRGVDMVESLKSNE